MKKYTVTQLLGVLGMIIWGATIFLRDSAAVEIPSISFILGIAPNIGAAWFFSSMVELVASVKWTYNMKIGVMSVWAIFILAIGSEIVHALFLNSPWDNYDIIATAGASVLYTILLLITYGKKEEKLETHL